MAKRRPAKKNKAELEAAPASEPGTIDAASIQALVERGAIAEAVGQARAALPALQGEERGHMLLALADACTDAGDALEGLRAAVGASDAFKSSGDRRGECDALNRMATALRTAGDPASAISVLEQAEEIARALAEPQRIAAVLRKIGVCSSLVGRHQHALSCLNEANAVFVASDNVADRLSTRLSACNARNRKAISLPADSDERRASLQTLLKDWRTLADDCRAAEHHRLELMARGNHAITLHQCGRDQEAIAELQALLPQYQALGMRPNEGLCLAEMGQCHEALGEAQAARESHLQALAILEDSGALEDLQASLEGLSRVEEVLGDAPAALAALRRVRAIDLRKSDEAARAAVTQRELRIELATLTSQWARHATEDPLTGLANRRGLDRWMAEHLPRVEHGEPLTLLLMDLDHFKWVNDRFGHGIGDEVLRRVARVVQASCRDRDLAVRYGGEEFVLALAGVDLTTAAGIAERLLASVSAQPWGEVAAGLQVTVSIGLAAASETFDGTALFTLADKRLYAAKYSGRNRVVTSG